MFLHPWAIAMGVAALALPVAVHWLTKPRPVRWPLSTVRFVMQAVRQRRARHRLRDILILTLRVLAVGLLSVAFARPIFGAKPVVALNDSAQAVRIAIVDQSLSMTARDRGIDLFERGRAIAARYLNYRPGLSINLILAAAHPHSVFEIPSTNFESLREELGKAAPGAQRLNLQEAIAAAGGMFAKAPTPQGAKRELVIVSDLQRSNFAAADFSPLPQDTLIQIESVAPEEPLMNVGILRVALGGRAQTGALSRVEIEVGNYSPAPQKIQVDLTVGPSQTRLEGSCPAGAKAVLAKEIALASEGWQVGEARLVGIEDALPSDDVRPFSVQVHRAPVYVLLTREASDQRPAAGYYLERALAPFAANENRTMERVVRVPPDLLDREALVEADLVTIVNPGKLAPGAIHLLAATLRRGRAIFYVATEAIDATNIKTLVDAVGPDLQMPVEFAPRPLRGSPAGAVLADVRDQSIPFRIFGEQIATIIKPLRFEYPMVSHRLERGLSDDVRATYSDGSACLIRTACGDAALAVLNADLSASNLPASPAFVPLIGEIVADLLRHRQADTAFTCGESFTCFLPLAKSVEGLAVMTPDGEKKNIGSFTEDKAGISWRCDAALDPGVYRILQGDTTPLAVAVAVPEEESDLRTLPASVLKDRLAGGRVIDCRNPTTEENSADVAWSWLATACVICMMAEMTLLRIFRT